MTAASATPAAMPRVALTVEYDGTAYCGWQAQAHSPSVQHTLEHALAQVAAGPVRVHVAGRTDTGVHATAQVVHFDPPASRPTRAWVLGTNAHLPPDVRVRTAQEVPADFHARFSAGARVYRYLLLTRTQAAALARNRAWQVGALDVPAMTQAGAALIGEHDFSAFRGAGCQSRTPMREVQRLDIGWRADWTWVQVQANAFLLHMVRNIVGMLVAVGRGELPASAAGALLAGRDRRAAPATAPPHGLYLVGVHYPARYGLVAPDPDEVP